MTKKTDSKTHFVMVTFGVRNAALKNKFQRLVKKCNQSESGLARELIKEGIERRLGPHK